MEHKLTSKLRVSPSGSALSSPQPTALMSKSLPMAPQSIYLPLLFRLTHKQNPGQQLFYDKEWAIPPSPTENHGLRFMDLIPIHVASHSAANRPTARARSFLVEANRIMSCGRSREGRATKLDFLPQWAPPRNSLHNNSEQNE